MWSSRFDRDGPRVTPPVFLSDVEARHDKMVGLVERMLDLHKRLLKAKSQADSEALQRQIGFADRQMDELVYELYGLTEEEVRIVEGDTR